MMRLVTAFVVVMSSVAPSLAAESGKALLQKAITQERELREKASMFDRGTDFSPAIDGYTRALEAGDLSTRDQARALLGRARLHVAQRDCQHAMQDIDGALTLTASSAEAYALRGSCRAGSGSHGEAVEDFTRVIALSPRDPSTYRARASSYSALGNYEGAVRDLTTSMKLLGSSQSSDLYVARGDAYLALNRYERAVSDYQRALRLATENAKKLAPSSNPSMSMQLAPILQKLSQAYSSWAKAASTR